MEKERLDELLKIGMSQRDMAKELGTCQSNIRYWLGKYNLTSCKVIERQCIVCGSLHSRRHSYYCSQKCMKQSILNRSIDKLKNGELCHSSSRRILILLHGNKCSICNNTSWNGGDIPVIMDHINGNPDDNSLKNLRLVCPNCDAMLPTYKAKNKGNGRYSRRMRYKNGVSY